MKSPKNIALAALVLLVIIVVFQNTAVVDTKILFMTISMPRALLLFVTLLIGVLAGLLIGNRRGKAKAAK
jgi:uncharacterized integral membrane protein